MVSALQRGRHRRGVRSRRLARRSEGTGWEQLTAELALERAGPERYLSTFPLFESFVQSRHEAGAPEQSCELIGKIIAQQIGLRLMSLSIARIVDQGGSPVAEAAMAKDLGTELEQLLVDELWRYRYEEIEPGPAAGRFHEFLDINRLRSPVFTTAGAPTKCCACWSAASCRAGPVRGRAGRSGLRWRRRCSTRPQT
jgi:hypothetical protein